MKFEFCLIYCFLGTAISGDSSIVDHYVNLINNEIARVNTFQLPQDSSSFKTNDDSIVDFGTFDYIIVGAGSAGCVIANRLSEIEENQILLLEAGGFETEFTDIPAMMFYASGLEFNWGYNSTPQINACLGMRDRRCGYPRGKGLGGSSIINGLMYVRGNKHDYDNWYKQGNPGWSYEEVLPYFKKSEDAHIVGDKGYHGRGGYLSVEYYEPYSLQLGAFIEANLELGRNVVDYNGKEQLGVAPTQVNNINGRRDSTGKAFLLPAINRQNLRVLTFSFVTRILIDPIIKKAYGVLFSNGEQQYIAKARKEVIISAGAVGSPQLLMLSGIGPEDHLLQHGIPVIQPLSVGDNFHDHPNFFGLHFETNYMEPIKSMGQYVKEYLHGFGPLITGGNVQGLGFFQTSMSSKIPGYPDIEIIIVPSNDSIGNIQNVLRFTDETYNSVFARIDPTRSFTFYLTLLHPKSRGTITLKSNNPYDYPLIDPRFLSDPYGEDIETLYQGIQLALEIVNTNAFRKLNANLIHNTLPACQNYEYLSKAYWYCQLGQLTASIFHPVGSCKMGPDPLKGAVVNHQLKVHGIDNLRVADASIIPTIISGHINAPAIMIGEKVSDMIKNGDRIHF